MTEYDKNHKLSLADFPPLPDVMFHTNYSSEGPPTIPALCNVCGKPFDRRMRVHVVEGGWLYGHPWVVIDTDWKCVNGHTVRNVRFESGNVASLGRWERSTWGYPSGPCFIATAAYGTPMAPELDYLRWYRDTVLLKHTLGKAFVWTYYHTSPPVADFIRKRDSLRAITRWWLGPIVAKCKSLNEGER